MIKVSTKDESFNQAWCNAHLALPVETLESPRQYGERWREAYRCRIVRGEEFPHTYYVFDRDEDYTWFMLRWL
jgi:hypothetical protein